ncbi:peptidoglycan-binding protein [Thauera sp. WH-1]|uniref:peptidoglycan-binding protein n=1 Tax=Thauera sp. WH-1 TaxID=3398230 RepID=UPI0039FCD04B
MRWTQDCLNRVMAAGLAVDGVMHAAARSVLRRFQQREGLPVTGIAGPDTEAALRRACAAVAERAAGAAPAGELGTARRAWSAELSLPAAIADPRSAGPGIYTLYRNGQRLYVGKAQDLRRRLQQHLWCLQHLGVAAGRYAVKLTPMRGATPAQLQRVESAAIARWGRRGKGGMLTNVKSSELEVEPWGEAWR